MRARAPFEFHPPVQHRLGEFTLFAGFFEGPDVFGSSDGVCTGGVVMVLGAVFEESKGVKGSAISDGGAFRGKRTGHPRTWHRLRLPPSLSRLCSPPPVWS